MHFLIKPEEAYSVLKEITGVAPQFGVLVPGLYLLYSCHITHLEKKTRLILTNYNTVIDFTTIEKTQKV